MMRKKVIVLGPQGTFSEEAAKKLYKIADISYSETINELFSMIEEAAVIPFENKVSGFIENSIDGLIDCDYSVVTEIRLPIHHHLGSFGKLEEIEKVFTHPHTYEQSKKTLLKACPKAKPIFTDSNAKAAKELLECQEKNAGAIIPQSASTFYGIPLILKCIEDNKENFTRFLAIEDSETEPSGKDHTLLFIFDHDLDIDKKKFEALFAKHQIPLLALKQFHLKKRNLSLYIIEFEGHMKDKKCKEVLNAMKKIYPIKIVGSYPVLS